MRRSHALAAGTLAVALAAAADARLAIPATAAATATAIALPRKAAAGGPRLALVAGAWAICARLTLAPPVASPAVGHADATWESTDLRSATVAAVTRQAGGAQTALLDAGGGLVYARLPRYPEIAAGDTVAVDGRLRPIPERPPPEVEGWVAYLRRIGVTATLEASSVSVAAPGLDPLARLAQLRASAGDLLGVALPEPQGGLAAAILIGLRERVDPGLARDFTASGLSHVVAISGWNIALVAATFGVLARRLSRHRRALVVGATVAAYAVLAGASPSVVRAALMAGVALAAREGGRRAGASRALALAVALMVTVDPGAVLDPGFQLSACATAGIVMWAAALDARLERAAPGVPGMIRESLAVSLTAQTATLPVVLLDFGRLSLVSPIANLVAAPLVPLVMAGAALALLLGALVGTGVPAIVLSLPLALADLPLAALVLVARSAASVPFASVDLPGPVALGAAVLAALALAVAHARRTRIRPPTWISPAAPIR